jgi:hypothetical protein
MKAAVISHHQNHPIRANQKKKVKAMIKEKEKKKKE